MAKFVILTQGLTDRSHELNADRTTVGRVEDNMFQIAEPSVSSHHCEVLLRGNDIVVKDLNSTNGTFIGGQKVTEAVLKPGQTLRLGNVELRLDSGAASAASSGGAPASAPAKKPAESTTSMQRGVSLSELEQGGRGPAFDSRAVFTKKTNKINQWFWIGAVIIGVVIVGLLLYIFTLVGGKK